MKIQSWNWIARCLAICVMLGLTQGAESQSQTISSKDAPFRTSIRALGMGGAYIAAGRNGGAFHYNPALLNQSHTDVSLAYDMGFDQNTVNVFDFIDKNQDNLKNFNDLTATEETQLFQGLTPFDGEKIKLRFIPTFNIVTHNFGLAAYGTVKVGAGVDRGIFEPRVLADGTADIVVMMGLAKRVSEKTAMGVNLKTINRRSADFRVGVTKLDDTFDSIIDSLKSSEQGYAVDFGLLHNLSDRTNFGFVVQDLYGKVGDDEFPMNIKAGLATHPNDNMTFALDVVDLLNKDGVSIFNRVHMGAEFRVPLLNFRGGFNQGYPTLGAGLNLKLIKIDYAFYRTENGRWTGLDGRSQHEFQAKIGWGW
ncbi:MAG: hypothetical protein HOH43_07265 [Candidatus Latescibacteria bacterium]|nr:hypothetical protein [Candidatus Latescibacterota bacterium]